MEERLAAYKKARDEDDLLVPHACNAAYLYPAAGTDLADIEPFTQELTGIVDKMKEELANETRILEGTEVPEYMPFDQNELSGSETKEDQWRTDLRSGSWKIDPTPITLADSDISFSTADSLSRRAHTRVSNESYIPWQRSSCPENSDAFGCETDITNASSECTVPMISAQTPGMPSEEK